MVTHLQLNHFQQEWLQWELKPSHPAVWLSTGTQDLHLYPLSAQNASWLEIIQTQLTTVGTPRALSLADIAFFFYYYLFN